MKPLKNIIATATISLIGASTLFAADIYKADAKSSEVKWNAAKVSGEHWGYVSVKDGYLEMDNGKLKGGKFNINMPSLTVEDIEDPEWNGKLKGHLHSDDFFSTNTYKTASLDITDVKQIKGNEYQINGDLTIKGIKKPVSFPATVTMEDGKVVGVGKMKIDRTDYDIKYNSGSFFEDLGDKMIYDEFDLDVRLVANK
jgi:polyisoprenoid-binding protein YceI